MKDRFTHETKFGRGSIPKATRKEVYVRDDYSCAYCKKHYSASELTIDHLVPLALGGHDEITNYVTSCKACNHKKGHMKLIDFCNALCLPVEKLPIYGDPVIDNPDLPYALRAIREKIFIKYRNNKIQLSRKAAQKKIEKTYRTEFWETPEGKSLESKFPDLPGHVRIMIPEILTFTNSIDDFLLLIELAKSANTRNIINRNISLARNIPQQINKITQTTSDEALKKRLIQAISRYEKAKNRYAVNGAIDNVSA